MHNAALLRGAAGSSGPVAFAGHTHGGQLRVPLLPRLPPARRTIPWPEYADGWLDGYGEPGNRLYVNGGIGFSRKSMRFGCLPELTLATLRSCQES